MEIESHIEQSVRRLTSHPVIAKALEAIRFKPKDLLLLNNSFVWREKASIRTNKSDLYLAIPITNTGRLSRKPKVVAGTKMNKDTKRVTQSEANTLRVVGLKEALAAQLGSLGKLLFILIGYVDDSVIIDQRINCGEFDQLSWDTSQRDLVSISGSNITVSDASDETAVWAAIESILSKRGDEVPHGFREAFAVAIDKLKDQAIADLILPSPESTDRLSMTESIAQVLKEQKEEYASALQTSLEQGSVSNDILRIAYNFASDAITFVRLIISICDLKPIVLWGTIDKHFALGEALRNLPWHRYGKKPSLQDYRSTIADARNSAFHNLFPFRKTLNVSLPDDSLLNARVRIFSEHSKKKQNMLLYQDRELVELLCEFTRARERRVALRFWESNLSMMEATIELCEATGRFLRLLLVEPSK